ncbi:hypothetical protein D3C76_1190960 [compost metagenome]
MALAQLLAAGDQCGVVLQTGQLLLAVQQTSTEVAFAGTPIEPVSRPGGEVQATGEGFDLLPFAPGYVDVEAMAWRFERAGRQFSNSAQCAGDSGQPWERRWRVFHQPRLVMVVFRRFQRTLA